MSTLKGLKARRDAALSARHFDVEAPGLPGFVVRFRPLTAVETQREATKVEKAKDKHAANVRLNAVLLGEAFIALLGEDGAVLADGITEDLMVEFVPDRPVTEVTKADVILGLFTDDFPLFKAGGELAQWSQGVQADVDGDLEN